MDVGITSLAALTTGSPVRCQRVGLALSKVKVGHLFQKHFFLYLLKIS